MLATLVIGLREGLEAALIVGIIAAFLRTNGKSLVPMWVGVATAVVLSIAVGIGLSLVEQSLPQAGQEAMESIIGAVAIVFVTGMIVWMNSHARGMKKELEAEAAAALSQGGAYALAGMAFLAVLKEGFETSVFLLATFSAAESAALAATGAVIGVLIAVAVGWGIYVGGVKLNLSKFFRATAAFLILVAAGLVVTTLRTAHEAGWVNVGQQQTVDLSWLVQPGTVQSALITGVLGIPADPRLIEVIGWFAYLIPVALYVYWPASRRPKGIAISRVQFSVAGGLAIAAVALAVAIPAVPTPTASPSSLVALSGTPPRTVGAARLVSVDGTPTTLSIALDGAASRSVPVRPGPAKPREHDGITASTTVRSSTDAPAGLPTTLTLTQLVALSGGRVPVGVSPQQHPGPYAARWTSHRIDTVWVADGLLLDANEASTTTVTISGSGLGGPRTFTVTGASAPGIPDTAIPSGWAVSADDVTRATATINDFAAARSDRLLWAAWLPIALGLAALICAIAGVRTVMRVRRASASTPPSYPTPTLSATPAAVPEPDSHQRSNTYAAH